MPSCKYLKIFCEIYAFRLSIIFSVFNVHTHIISCLFNSDKFMPCSIIKGKIILFIEAWMNRKIYFQLAASSEAVLVE